jgi:hypothetical protein
MTMIDTGTVTSSRRRKRKVLSPEEMLASFRTDGATAEEAREAAHDCIFAYVPLKDEGLHGLIMSLVDDALARKVKDPRPATDRAASEAVKQAAVETIRQGFEAKVEAEVTIRLLEWVTPNGKPLAECTGKHCARLSRRCGSFFRELADRLSPSETVGGHYSEWMLQELAKIHRLIGPRAER